MVERCCLIFKVADDFRQAEHAHRDHHEADAVGELGNVEGVALHAGVHVRADQSPEQTEHDHADGVQQRSLREHNRGHQSEHHEREIIGRAKLERDLGERRGEESEQQGRDRAGEK